MTGQGGLGAGLVFLNRIQVKREDMPKLVLSGQTDTKVGTFTTNREEP
ncbi:TPA: hypothetical protein ACGO6G_001414 [Streptococcus suis]